LKNLQDDDIVICSDADEIINPDVADNIRNTYEHSRLEQLVFYYYLNCGSSKVEYRGSAFLRGRHFTSMQNIRRPVTKNNK
jgi:hypothetical protein